jgi:hypothetical protein
MRCGQHEKEKRMVEPQSNAYVAKVLETAGKRRKTQTIKSGTDDQAHGAGLDLPPRIRRLTGLLGKANGGIRTLYTSHTLREGLYVNEDDILDFRQAPVDADGLQRDILFVDEDADIIRWSRDERRDRSGGNGFDPGPRPGIIRPGLG